MPNQPQDNELNSNCYKHQDIEVYGVNGQRGCEACVFTKNLLNQSRNDGYKQGVIDATGGISYPMPIPVPIKSMRTRNTAFKKYAVKYFNGKIQERRERLLASKRTKPLKEDI
jgi:hypothetical protein